MAARLDSVAKYICEKSGWSVSNLQLQKLLYLAQMVHMGRKDGSPLFDGGFQAWDYGPVEPNLYHKAKVYGANPVKDIFSEAKSFSESDYRRKIMDDVCERFLEFDAGQLVDITHWDEGAWAKHYVPKWRNIQIPNADIKAEYEKRQNR